MRQLHLLLCAALLTGCAAQALNEQPPAATPSAPMLVQADALSCQTRAQCTTKVSRTLLFVFDYAAAGGALVQRKERLLFTPPEAASNEWPALRIVLAEPSQSAFSFSAECRQALCRYDEATLLRVYRSYLAGEPCSLLLDASVRRCGGGQ